MTASGSAMPKVCCKPVRSGARLIRDEPAKSGRNTIVARPFIGACPPYLGGDGDSHEARSCRRRNAAVLSAPYCRQRHRCKFRSIRKLSGVSGCPLPHWLGISSRRILRRSILWKWTTAVPLVQSTPPLLLVRRLIRMAAVASGHVPGLHSRPSRLGVDAAGALPAGDHPHHAYPSESGTLCADNRLPAAAHQNVTGKLKKGGEVMHAMKSPHCEHSATAATMVGA